MSVCQRVTEVSELMFLLLYIDMVELSQVIGPWYVSV